MFLFLQVIKPKGVIGVMDLPAKAHAMCRKPSGHYCCAYCRERGISRSAFAKKEAEKEAAKKNKKTSQTNDKPPKNEDGASNKPPKKEDGTVIFPEEGKVPSKPAPRTHQSELAAAILAHETLLLLGKFKGNEETEGTVDLSPLFQLAMYDVIEDTAPGYLHGLCLGVIRLICQLLLKSGESCYLGSKADVTRLEENITTVSLPSFLQRRGRASIATDAKLKASEYRFFLLHLAPILFRKEADNLETSWLKTFGKLIVDLANTTHSALTPDFNGQNAESIGEAFDLFVCKFAQLFGQRYVTYAIHQTKHFGRFLIRHGVLSAYDEFGLESYYGRLARFVTGPNDPLSQITKRVQIDEHLRYGGYRFTSADTADRFYESLQTRPMRKSGERAGDSAYLTCKKDVILSAVSRYYLYESCGIEFGQGFAFDRSYRKCLSELGVLKGGDAIDDSATTIQLNDSRFGVCAFFFKADDGQLWLAYRHVFVSAIPGNANGHTRLIDRVASDLEFVLFENVKVPCCIFKVESTNELFLSPTSDKAELAS